MKLIFTLLLTFLLLTNASAAQNGTLSGTVTDAKTHDPIPFATLTTLSGNTIQGIQTDIDGNYILPLPEGTYLLSISSVGYEKQQIAQTIKAGETTLFNIALKSTETILDAVVVTGSKFEQRLGEQTVSLEVIKPSLIENTNSTAADQAIQRVPGVVVIDQQANIRGGSGFSYGAGSRVLLLMDDMPMLTADLGFPRWDFMPIENLEQIEIIKGASSALYGSAAMNGIINMRTAYPKSEPVTKFALFNNIYQNPRDNTVITLNTDGSPRDTLQKSWWGNEQPYERGASFAHRQRYGQFDLVAGAYLYDHKSWRATEFSRRGRGNVNMRYRFKKAPGLSAGLNTNYQAIKSGTFLIWNGIDADAYKSWAANDTIINRTHLLTIDPFVEYFNAASGIKQKLIGRYYKNNNHTTQNRTTLSDLYYGEYQFQKRFETIDLVLTTGVVSNYAKVDAELYTGGNHTSSNVGAYLQGDKKFMDKVNVSLGVRYERNKIDTLKAEAKPVYRAGVNYQPAEYTFIRASYGEAYRFPTISEKYLNTSVGGGALPIGVFPNPDLVSETGWSAEVGIKQGFKISDWTGFADIAGFISQYDRMMEFSFGTPASPIGNYPGVGYKSLNVGDTQITGLDCSIAGQGKLFGMPTNLLAGYTYIDPIYRTFDQFQKKQTSDSTQNVLKYRFRHMAKLDAETTANKVTVGVTVQYNSFMEAIDKAFVDLMPGVKKYRAAHQGESTMVWSARIAYNIASNASISFLCNNLTNLEYALSPVKIEAPRNFTLRFNYNIDYSKN